MRIMFQYNYSYFNEYYFFSEVVQHDEFMGLEFDKVCDLIKSDRLFVTSEEKVYECVITWTQSDPANRQQHLPSLMEHVRLPLLTQEYLVQRVEREPLLKADIKCKDYLIEALTFHLQKMDLRNLTKTTRMIPRQAIGVPKILLVIGGQAPKAIRSVECYDLREEKWYQAAELPSRRCR